MAKFNELEEGKEYIAYSPNGSEILGTYERLTARAEISYFTKGTIDHGVDYMHQGETEVFWDGSETVTKSLGRQNGPDDDGIYVVYLCRNGDEWTIDQLTFKELTDG